MKFVQRFVYIYWWALSRAFDRPEAASAYSLFYFYSFRCHCWLTQRTSWSDCSHAGVLRFTASRGVCQRRLSCAASPQVGRGTGARAPVSARQLSCEVALETWLPVVWPQVWWSNRQAGLLPEAQVWKEVIVAWERVGPVSCVSHWMQRLAALVTGPALQLQ